MYQINSFNASSEREQAFCTILLHRFLSQKISILLVLLGVLFPSIEVLASYSNPNSNSNNTSVGVGGAIYQSCGGCTDPENMPVSCGINYTVKPLAFNLNNKSANNLILQNIYSIIIAPDGQVINPLIETYSEVVAIGIGGQNPLLSPLFTPQFLTGAESMQIMTKIGFVFCDLDPLNPTSPLPGNYTVNTFLSGTAGNGDPFTITVSYTFDVTVGGGGTPPPFLKTAPAAIETISALKWAPNPSTDIARLSFQLNEAGPVDIDILNLTGQIVEQRSIMSEASLGEQSIKWNIAHLAPGIYFARVRSRTEEKYVKWVKI